MKIRKGFISNSSASSFVIAKAYVNEEQLKAIRVFWAEKLGDSTLFKDRLNESDCYISYDLYHICDEFYDMCEKNGIKDEWIYIDEVDGMDHPVNVDSIIEVIDHEEFAKLKENKE